MESTLSFKVKTRITRILLVLLGTFIGSIAINAFYIPRNILSGGITGIATLLNIQFGFNIGLAIIIINIPIFIIGYHFVNQEFIVFSLIGMFSLSFFLQLTSGLSYESNNLLTTILFGGLMNGVGFGLVLRANASTGGNDIISKILNRKFSYSIATFSFGFNLLVIGLSALFFNLDIAVETLTTMYISSLTVTFILEGSNYKRTVFIITKHEQQIAADINEKLTRGCTIIEGTGSFTQEKRTILYAVISITQVAKLKLIVKEIDPHAFINVIETKAVFGNGFLNLREK